MRQDATTLRIALAYARHAAHNGNVKLAKEILDGQAERSQGEPHVLVRELREEIVSGKKTDLLITTPAEGMAEVFYGLGEALTSEGGLSMGILYLQLALYAKPDHAFALAALASAYETANATRTRSTPTTAFRPARALQPAIDIRKAFDLNSLEKVDEAKKILDRLATESPTDLKPLDALGNILRARKRYGEAVETYTAALKLIPKPDKRHWSIFYSRGTCYERLKNWPAAEADLQKALELYPDQPLALNYLGYSWVDQNRNLKQGMALIEKAVALKPDDGYIVDSLGWAHYKLGNYAEAVRFLERAVELKPQDPVLNDHLGDALWRVGREREAKFQWDQSLTLDPEPEEMEKIKKKLAEGLPPAAEARVGPARDHAPGAAEEAQRDEAQSRACRITPKRRPCSLVSGVRHSPRAARCASFFQGTSSRRSEFLWQLRRRTRSRLEFTMLTSKTFRRPRRLAAVRCAPSIAATATPLPLPRRPNGNDGWDGRLPPLLSGPTAIGSAVPTTTMNLRRSSAAPDYGYYGAPGIYLGFGGFGGPRRGPLDDGDGR